MKTSIEVGRKTKRVIMVTQLYVCWRWSDLFVFRGYIYLAKAVYFKYAIGLMFPAPYSSRKLVIGSTPRGHTCQGSFKSDCHHQELGTSKV